MPRRVAVQIHGLDANFKLGEIAEGEFLKRQGNRIVGGEAGGDSGAIEEHEAAIDPHPGYLTGVEGDALYEAFGAAADAVAAHEALADPHPGYTTAAEAAAAAPVQSVAGKTGVVALAKADVGLGNVDNTSDASKPVSTATQTALDAKQATSAKGQANGYASLGADGLVPSAQLPASAGGGGPTKISGSSGAFSGDTTWITLTSNSADVTSTTQTTVATITGLGAGTYRVKGAVVFQAAATTTGIGITLNHTGTVSRFVSNWIHITTGGAAATGISDQSAATAAGQMVEGKAERAKDTRSSFTVGVDTQNADELAIIDALIVVTVTGSLELKIATEIAGSAVRLMAGSSLEVNKLA